MSKKIAALLALSIGMSSVIAAEATKIDATPAAADKNVPAEKKISPEMDARFDFLPEVVATTVDGNITKKEFIDFILSQLPDGKLPDTMTADAFKATGYDFVKNMAMAKIIVKELKKDGITLTKERTLAMLNDAFEKGQLGDQNQIKAFVASQGMTLESFFEKQASMPYMQLQAAVGAYLQKLADEYTPGKEEIKKYYDAHAKELYEEPDKKDDMRASHILVMVDKSASDEEVAAAKAKIDAIRARVVKGEDFSKVAAEVSDCDSGKRSGGSLGAFGKGKMVPEFEKAVEGLKDDELSQPVRSPFGFHIIRREKLRDGGQIPLDKVEGGISAYLKEEKVRNGFSDQLKKWETDNKLEIKLEAPQKPAMPMMPMVPAAGK
ncbi:MAG: peptidylprolyl isomerase [Victivallaceae bacterium]